MPADGPFEFSGAFTTIEPPGDPTLLVHKSLRLALAAVDGAWIDENRVAACACGRASDNPFNTGAYEDDLLTTVGSSLLVTDPGRGRMNWASTRVRRSDMEIDTTVKPSGDGCVECDASQGWWVHLRRCAECGHVGCCDSSPGQHATHHYEETGHTVMRSFEPGEEWFYDFSSETTYESGPQLADPQNHPRSQPAPGPEGRVPADWQDHVR